MKINNIKSTLDNLDKNTVSSEQLNQIIDNLSGKEMEFEIKRRQQQIEEANTIKIQSETKIATYRNDYAAIVKEFKAMNIDPNNIKEELVNLCKELVQITVDMDKYMPDIDSIKKLLNSNNGNTVNNNDFNF